MFSPEPVHEHGSIPRVGILLVNLGTPDAPRRRLCGPTSSSFSDPRVVELPRAWGPILNLVILNTRPRRSAAKTPRSDR
jgi:ferrochelatase